MEEYIITRDLHIINTETGIPSFETNRWHSWIDLTLCNSKLAQNIKRWTCREEESCADHKMFRHRIKGPRNIRPTLHSEALQYKSR